MSASHDRLESWKQIAQIASSIAVPIVLGVVGWIVQNALADAGLKKDYVQIALAVLKEQPRSENKELRQWAISVLDKNSPVPLPIELKGKLQSVPDLWGMENLKSPAVEKFEVECIPAPNAETVEWLIGTFPLDYVRCSNAGEVGHRKYKSFAFGEFVKSVEPRASGSK